MQRFTPGHPLVAAIDAQLADLQREQNQLTAKVSSLPDTQQAAVRLMRDVNVNTGLYMNLMTSAQQLQVLKAGQQGNVRVVDYAVVAEQPVKPKKAIVIGAAGVLGLLLGVAAALLRRSLNRGMEDTVAIEEAAGVPVYAVILHSERQIGLQRAARRGDRGQHVLASSSSGDIAVEGTRTCIQVSRTDILKSESTSGGGSRDRRMSPNAQCITATSRLAGVLQIRTLP